MHGEASFVNQRFQVERTFCLHLSFLVNSELGFIIALMQIAVGKQENDAHHGTKRNIKIKSDLVSELNLPYVMLLSLRCAFSVFQDYFFFHRKTSP